MNKESFKTIETIIDPDQADILTNLFFDLQDLLSAPGSTGSALVTLDKWPDAEEQKFIQGAAAVSRMDIVVPFRWRTAFADCPDYCSFVVRLQSHRTLLRPVGIQSVCDGFTF